MRILPTSGGGSKSAPRLAGHWPKNFAAQWRSRVPTHNVAKLLKGNEAKWYQKEKNTAALLQAVVSERSGKPFSGDDIWHLLRLTWTTKARDHWRKLKVPALRHLFSQDESVQTSLRGAAAP